MRSAWLPRLAKWSAELLLVFLGAYAAFWLTNHQEHLREARHRQLILAALEEQFAHEIDTATAHRDETAKGLAAFHKKLAAGEMPALNTFSFTTDYSATDIAAMLQSGGYQLLDVKTLFALRRLETVLRGGISRLQRAEQLSDSLILPNLDQDTAFFYDPATKQLRKRFTRYIEAIEGFVPFYDDYIKALTDLLTQIRIERQKSS